LRTNACQRRKSTRLCSVAPIRASTRRPSSGVARPRRTQRDPLGRKLEIEQVDAHRRAA